MLRTVFSCTRRLFKFFLWSLEICRRQSFLCSLVWWCLVHLTSHTTYFLVFCLLLLSAYELMWQSSLTFKLQLSEFFCLFPRFQLMVLGQADTLPCCAEFKQPSGSHFQSRLKRLAFWWNAVTCSIQNIRLHRYCWFFSFHLRRSLFILFTFGCNLYLILFFFFNFFNVLR